MHRHGLFVRFAQLAAAVVLLLPSVAAAEPPSVAGLGTGIVSALPYLLLAVVAVAAAAIVFFALRMQRHKRMAWEQQRAAEEQHRDALRHMLEYDALTGVFNEQKFIAKAAAILDAHPDRRFVIVRMDINRFQLVNAYFGKAEGDRVLQHLARVIGTYVKQHAPAAYGRAGKDVFVLLCPFSGDIAAQAMISELQTELASYPIAFRLSLTIGLFVVTDKSLSVPTMLDRAALAAKSVKGNYARPYAYFQASMGAAIESEQEFINDMPQALKEGQFEVKIQPVYALSTGNPAGGEALVRWEHPEKGDIPPNDFIPVFEKNGLIMQLDAFVWERVCAMLRTWLDAGKEPAPVSVNVSRVNLHNPNIVKQLCDLVDAYRIPPRLLQLEMTESAYTDNPQQMKIAVSMLRGKGFTVLMDDFGNGYSSLNILKDIDVDALKIDMQFLARSDIPGRGENIVASVVRMAKWLGLPVIAEGTERKEQVEFLRSIGCDYAQGYYFSEAVEQDAYAEITDGAAPAAAAESAPVDVNSLWASNTQMEILFSDALYAAGLYEYDPETRHVECLRVNKAFGEMLGFPTSQLDSYAPLDNAVGDYRNTVLDAAEDAVATGNASQCEYLRKMPGGKHMWVDLKIKYLSCVGGKHILMASFFNITAYKETEQELQRFRSAISNVRQQAKKLLIVDDQPINREILKKIFKPAFDTLEAADGQEALAVLAVEGNRNVDAILLDMVMPVMDGEAFLTRKREDASIADIPVIIVTADDSAEKQINMLAIGAHDYIVKPLIPEVVRRRVDNVIESSNRFRTMLREYQDVVEQAKADPLTRVYNRAAAEQMITDILQREPDLLHALVMIDLDDFKNINDTYGHSYGDMVLMEFGAKLNSFFRAGDIVARMGGDEFCVFMRNIRTAGAAQDKCQELCRTVRQLAIGDEHVRMACSVGVAASTPESTFGELYRQADSALYQSKRSAKNRSTLYVEA